MNHISIISARGTTVLLSSLFFSACQYDPHAHLYTTIEPKDEDLVGTYVLKAVHMSVAGMPTDIEVTLFPNYSFVAKNLPPWTQHAPEKNFAKTLVSGAGRWEKRTAGTLHPGDKRIWGVYLRTPDNRFEPANLTGPAAPYGLIFVLGDPDTGDAILLRKTTAAS